ncbi:poly-gamma-glutamate hydrolase family protein [Staphylococcus pseudoxylosus]|uniref:poly-gamma-glutamate hydrolase family protein n=1 Tax=Staphylococcus pseudoxylosus TaxID=2282419 RepID=UPI0029904DFA|nr:poly-gamma-glutamate hydrolase family protein [Staphylococcus pseudoxylosus]MDW8798961.1 poly-gamma-glutamate hydrolase family protein [Staphylococcus pseudoxylosus]MEB6035656.1 poly-gamma-glutamate hydrolase family protein [Staphylococcus pseudoxylosus]MEB6044940.1 poly-gamma-glutamate hydrolase family protein [Staphylococcus pseudoxylosus]MEB7763270.1 poly-gamma-glutamate hydrolase family protein [Staphylococcus pseudoxylosus]MEB8007819.1 poly-gamma-glutamate hydrolase family protein [Sta
MVDKFKSMTELIAKTTEHREWEIQTVSKKSSTLITAIHGGAIERGTTEIAQLISEQGDHSFYSFKGIRNNKNNELHVTSRHFNEPKLAQMVSDHHNIVSLHGCMGDVPEVYIGGRDFELASEIKSQLEKVHIIVKPAPSHISGMHMDNFVNAGQKNAGVQLELTVALRKQYFKNNKYNLNDRENRQNWSQFMYVFSTAVNKAINNVEETK